MSAFVAFLPEHLMCKNKTKEKKLRGEEGKVRAKIGIEEESRVLEKIIPYDTIQRDRFARRRKRRRKEEERGRNDSKANAR